MRKRLIALAFTGLSFGLLLGQGDKATVVGTVSDSTGAVIPGAEVYLTRLATNEVVTTLTSDTGDYAMRGLVSGVYELRVSMPGFKTDVRSGLKLDVGQTYRIDVPLSLGEVAETVEVAAIAPILKTETPELAQVIDNQKIIKMPLNERDVFGTLGSLTPGVAPGVRNGLGGRVSFVVKGQRNSDNTAMIDGSLVSETNAGLEFRINPDAVQEFEIKSGLYGAEYGIKPGGQFSLITKSGTNDLHGTLFWFHRNDNLDARNFFDPGPRPEFKRNQFGAVAGGPIVLPRLLNGKDKAWWFFSYSGERIRRFRSLTGNVPTTEEKAGQYSSEIIDPMTGEPFPNNRIPQNRFDSVYKELVTFYPEANTPPGRGFNYISASNAARDTNEFIARIDFKTGENSRWAGRFFYNDAPHLRVNPIDFFTKTDTLTNFGQNLTNTRNFGANVVNEFGFHFYRRPYNPGFDIAGPEGYGKTLDIANWPQKGIDQDGIPRASVTGMLLVGDHSIKGPVPEGNWEVKNNISWTKGSHYFKAGYHMRYQYLIFGFERRTNFSFSNDRYTGNGFANFQLGHLTRAALGSESFLDIGEAGHHFYLQDSWKVSPKFTLNLGLRYELRTGYNDKKGYLTNIEPECLDQNLSTPFPNCFAIPLTIADPVFPETGRFEANKAIYRHSKAGFQPRLGLSYRATDNTVIRSGFGIYGNEAPGGLIYGALLSTPRPNAGSREFTSDPAAPNLPLSDPFNEANRVVGGGLPNIGGFQDPMPQWYVINWGLSVQRRLSGNTLFEIGYQGSRSVHEMQIMEWNDAAPGSGDRQSRRPYPAIQRYHYLAGNGDKNYNGLEVKVEKRPGPEGLTALMAYTWSKSLDTMGGRFVGNFDPRTVSRNRTLRDNRGRGEANIPGRLALMMGYDIPFGPGWARGSDTAAGKILGGWSLYGLLTLQKGLWFTPFDLDRLDVGSNSNQRPQVSGNPNLGSGTRRPERWFDTSAYSVPPPLSYGNAGRGSLEGPGIVNLDLSILRQFRTSENTRVEFRFEAFNLTNHTNFLIPQNSFASSSFGAIGSALEARDLQFGLKFYY